jgi:kynurenine formamidase
VAILCPNQVKATIPLRDLHLLPNDGFRFFAIPIKAVGAAAMTVRAFAEV